MHPVNLNYSSLQSLAPLRNDIHINHLINIEKQGRYSLKKTWLVAASLTMIIGLSAVFFFQNKQNRNDREFLSGVLN